MMAEKRVKEVERKKDKKSDSVAMITERKRGKDWERGGGGGDGWMDVLRHKRGHNRECTCMGNYQSYLFACWRL